MKEEIILAVIQGITEFLPVSSSGHLALVSNLISEPNLFFMVAMHIASLLAILIYFRKHIVDLVHFEKKKNWHWYKVILIGIIPTGIVGYFFSDLIDKAINNYFFIGTGFLFTTLVLLGSKLKNGRKKKIQIFDSLIIGLAQIFALFPGVSRSGTTTATGIIRSIDAKTAGRFSFLMFIPLMIGAMITQTNGFYFNIDLAISFAVCFFVSLGSLGIFFKTLKNSQFWLFAVWTTLMAIISFSLEILV
jgi:undecaprenyl-diphosphatase